MTETWATSGVDLHLDVTGPRVRAGLEDALRDAVRTGRLPPGARLPSSRALAGDLGIARNTVADAYGQLVAEGWLVARRGSGTRVAERAPEQAAATPTREEATGPPATTCGRARPTFGVPAVGLARGSSPRARTPRRSTTLGYGDPRGRPELRRALAGYLARARGVRVDPERLVVCSGFTQGLGLRVPGAASRGARTLAVEAYGQPSHREVAVGAGLDVRAAAGRPARRRRSRAR